MAFLLILLDAYLKNEIFNIDEYNLSVFSFMFHFGAMCKKSLLNTSSQIFLFHEFL